MNAATALKKFSWMWSREYRWWLILVAAAYIIITVVISRFYEILYYLPVYSKNISWVKFLSGIALTMIIGIMAGANAVLIMREYKIRKERGEDIIKYCPVAVSRENLPVMMPSSAKRGSKISAVARTTSVTGMVAGMSAGVCASCATTIFPWLSGILGLSFSYGTLPWRGVEIQLISIGILGWSRYRLDSSRQIRDS